MRGSAPGQAAAMSPLSREFDAFLFAPIGDEKNDMALTVLSALARLGIDPWRESARLAELAPETATQRLMSIISGLPNGRWAPSDVGAIAARLLELLPTRRKVDPATVVASQFSPTRSRIAMLVFAAALSGLMFSAILGHVRPATEIGIDRPAADAGAVPQVPLVDTH